MAGAFDPDAFIGNNTSASAPAFDPDAFIGTPKQPQVSLAADAAKSAPGGLLSGFVNWLNASGQPEMDSMTGGTGPQGPNDAQAKALVQQNLMPKVMADATSYQPQTWAGQGANWLGQVLGNPASYFGPGGLARNALSSVMAAGMGSGAADITKALGGGELAQTVAGTLGGLAAPTMHGMSPEGNYLLPFQLRQAGGRNLQAFRDSGVQADPGLITRWADSQRGMLHLTNMQHPGTMGVLDDLTSRPQTNTVPYMGSPSATHQITTPAAPVDALALDKAKTDLNEIGRQRQANGTPTPDAAAARRVLGAFNRDMPNMLQPGVGDVPGALQSLQTGNANYAAGSIGQRFKNVMDMSELKAQAANSGMNLGNTLRTRLINEFGSEDSYKRNGLSDAQSQAVDDVINGDITTNKMRRLSNQLGGGGGIAGTFMKEAGSGIGGMIGGFPGMVGGAVAGHLLTSLGHRLRMGSNDRTLSQTNDIYQSVLGQAPANVGRTGPITAGQLRASTAIKRILNGYQGSQQ